jgi:hypothetical protein
MKNRLQYLSVMAGLAITGLANQTFAFTLPGPGASHQSSISDFLGYLLNVFIYPILSIIALASLVWGGVILIMSGGDESKVKQGRTIIMYAIAGILLLLLSYAIISMLTNLVTKFVY